MGYNLNQKIRKLKEEKNAIILAHYYQNGEIQDIADAVGDSYYLSKIAKNCKENVIVFCGVKFMAESAKILSPKKKVLLPVFDAGCSMADMADAKTVSKMKQEYPDAKVVCYINSTAEVKAVSDVCCTSSNAVKIINNIEEKEIIFLPDKNLGAYIQKQVPRKKIILWDGFCITHKEVTREQISKVKDMYPDIKILVHPECEMEVIELGDFVGSTGEIISYATNSDFKRYLIVTEEGVLHELKKKNPNKEFFTPTKAMICADMKKTTLEALYNSLLYSQHEIILDEDLRKKAYNSLINMHTLAK